MPTTVFLVHGMGLHSDQWCAATLEKLRELYERYPRLKAIPFKDRIRPVPLQYDAVFKQILASWDTGAEQVGERAEELGNHPVQELVGWLKNSSTETDNFAWTHAADVVMYRGFASVRQQTKVTLANTMRKALDEMGADDQWVVLAHSLGTAVAHDTLHALWSTKNPDESPTGYGAKDKKARAVIMIANVSRALQTAPEVLSGSFVRPGAASAADCGCFRYLNVRHVYDPFVHFQPFKPTAWPTAEAEASKSYLHIQPDHIWQSNVHDLNHYLESPHVHIPVLRAIGYDAAITEDEEREAIGKFNPYGPFTEAIADRIRGELKKHTPAGTEDWTSWAKTWDFLFDNDTDGDQ